MSTSFLDLYLSYTKETEAPYIYHRWCALSGLGAILGRNFHLQFGGERIHPNLYCMLVGLPGVRKTSAIRVMRKLAVASGYETIAADKTTKEKFLLDLQGGTEGDGEPSGDRRTSYDRATAQNLWGSEKDNDGTPREVFITADEFNDFTGQNNVDFCRLLGVLWDYEGTYKSRIKNGVSVAIPEPTISILAGITPQDFALSFPAELMGQGFISRLLLIHAERSKRRYTIPPTPDPKVKEELTDVLKKIQQQVRGCAEITPEAFAILHKIYHEWEDLQDVRFRSYSTRRLTQLLRIVLVCAAGRIETRITPSLVVEANTYLTAAEIGMPDALGQYGKGKHSAVADKLMVLLSTANEPVEFKELWAEVHKDLEKASDMAVIVQGLEAADKIHRVKGLNKAGWLAKAPKKKEHTYVDWSLLTEEERLKV